MTYLSDRDLLIALGRTDPDDTPRPFEPGSLVIDPITDLQAQIQTASVDLTLGKNFTRFANGFGPVYADKGVGPDDLIPEVREEYVTIRAGEFVLGHTAERVGLPPTLAAHVDGRSSMGRIGLAVHITAGFIDPGFEGQITLEIRNLSRRDIIVPIGFRVCQLLVSPMLSIPARPYGSEGLGSHYQGQSGAHPYAAPLTAPTGPGKTPLPYISPRALRLLQIAARRRGGPDGTQHRDRPLHVGKINLQAARELEALEAFEPDPKDPSGWYLTAEGVALADVLFFFE